MANDIIKFSAHFINDPQLKSNFLIAMGGGSGGEGGNANFYYAATKSDFPTQGQFNWIYVTYNNYQCYIWDGSNYVEIEHNEIERALAAESTLNNKITQEISDRTSQCNLLRSDLDALSLDLSTETSNRAQADAQLSSNLLDEVQNREQADSSLSLDISNETQARIQAVNELTLDYDDHTHTINNPNPTTIYSITSLGSVVEGQEASFENGFYSEGTPASYTGHTFNANVPTRLDLTKFDGGSIAQYGTDNFTANVPTRLDLSKFSAGTPTVISDSTWSFSVNDDTETLVITGGNSTHTNGVAPSLGSGFYTEGTSASYSHTGFNGGSIASIADGFYTEGTPATHNTGTFTAGRVTELDLSKFNGGTPTSVTLPTRTAVNNVWVGESKESEKHS